MEACWPGLCAAWHRQLLALHPPPDAAAELGTQSVPARRPPPVTAPPPGPDNEQSTAISKRPDGKPWSAGFTTFGLDWERDRITGEAAPALLWRPLAEAWPSAGPGRAAAAQRQQLLAGLAARPGTVPPPRRFLPLLPHRRSQGQRQHHQELGRRRVVDRQGRPARALRPPLLARPVSRRRLLPGLVPCAARHSRACAALLTRNRCTHAPLHPPTRPPTRLPTHRSRLPTHLAAGTWRWAVAGPARPTPPPQPRPPWRWITCG